MPQASSTMDREDEVVAFSVDAVFIVVGDQATAIVHFIQTENSSLFQS